MKKVSDADDDSDDEKNVENLRCALLRTINFPIAICLLSFGLVCWYKWFNLTRIIISYYENSVFYRGEKLQSEEKEAKEKKNWK